MIPPDHTPAPGIIAEDFDILRNPFIREVEDLLPMPASVSFCPAVVASFAAPGGGSLKADDVECVTSNLAPRILVNRLILPLPLRSGEIVEAVVTDIDPPLMQKMSTGWMREMQSRLHLRLERARLAYVDPETEMYNRRALEACLEDPGSTGPSFLFLFQASFPKRGVTGSLQRHRKTADFLRAITQGAFFSFGFGVFGLLKKLGQREQALKAAHDLQHFLKREGLKKAPLAFAYFPSPGRKKEYPWFDRVLLALNIAEKRGPFGISDADAADDKHGHPFRFPRGQAYDQIKKKWRGLELFTVAVLSSGGRPQEVEHFDHFMGDLLAEKGGWFFRHETFVVLLFPGVLPVAVMPWIEELVAKGRDDFDQGDLSVGVAGWPYLDFRKNDIPGNCLKALLHGTFLGAGAVVNFDHLTLNISGDFFFEEGDYRAATREYRRGLQLQPQDVNLLNSLGVTLVECNLEQEAARCFQGVLEHDPGNYMALINLGNVRQTMGRREEALAIFSKGMEVADQPNAAGQELYLPLGKLYLEFGFPEQAVEVLERWRSRPGSEKEFVLHRLLGQGYMECGNLDEAMRSCQRALQLFPQDSASLSLLGLLYVEGGQGEETGLALCNKALALDSTNPAHWSRLARALLHCGKVEEALAAVKRCLTTQRNHVEGILTLGQIYLHIGKTDLAEKKFDQARSLRGGSGGTGNILARSSVSEKEENEER